MTRGGKIAAAIVGAVVIVMLITNPTGADFESRSRESRRRSASSISEKAEALDTGSVFGSVWRSVLVPPYRRSNFLLFSIYTIDVRAMAAMAGEAGDGLPKEAKVLGILGQLIPLLPIRQAFGASDIATAEATPVNLADHSSSASSEEQEDRAEAAAIASVEGGELLVDRWWEAEEECRGGSGDDEPRVLAACLRRDIASDERTKAGLCYGREGEARVEYKIHRCAPGSLGYDIYRGAETRSQDCASTVQLHAFLSRAQYQCGFSGYASDFMAYAAQCYRQVGGSDAREMAKAEMQRFDGAEGHMGHDAVCESVLENFPHIVSR